MIDIALAVCVKLDLGYPASYADAFRVLARQGVIDDTLADRLVRAAGFRNVVAHAYDTLDMQRVHGAAANGPADLLALLAAVEVRVSDQANHRASLPPDVRDDAGQFLMPQDPKAVFWNLSQEHRRHADASSHEPGPCRTVASVRRPACSPSESGLFDYFDDRVFEKVANRLMGMLAPGAELIVGNFAMTNPSRPHMELLCDWYLHHRSVEQLVSLMLNAGARPDDVRVGVEAEGVNLFVHARRPL